MNAISILGEPPTPAEILALRKEAGSAMDTATNVMLFTPLPYLDMVAGAVAGGVDHLVNGSNREKLDPAPNAVSRDWSATTSAQAYVDKVRKQGRDLLKGEVEALDEQISTERAIRHTVDTGLGAAMDFMKARAFG